MTNMTPPQPSPKGEGAGTEERTRRAVERMLRVLTLEQLEQWAEVLEQTYDMAVIRECEQTVTVLLNDKGFPRGFNASNNVRVVKPKVYHAE
jgi:hypothetical protein